MDIQDQVVLITGGGRGLGAALSRAFARAGAHVAINYYSRPADAQLLAASLGGKSVALAADVRDGGQVQRLFEQTKAMFGRSVTTVVNNALGDFHFNGEARPKAETIRWEAFEAQLAVSLHGALNTIQAAAPEMASAGFGRIINVGTNLFQNPVVAYHDYTAAKAALLSLTRTAARDLGELGITVNMVSGGLLRTTDASAATPDSVFEAIAASTPLRRVTTPEELADAALFFASPWSRAVTGQNLIVDGGLVSG